MTTRSQVQAKRYFTTTEVEEGSDTDMNGEDAIVVDDEGSDSTETDYDRSGSEEDFDEDKHGDEESDDENMR